MALRLSHRTSYACISNRFPSTFALIGRSRMLTTRTVLSVARTRTLGTSSAATGTVLYAVPGGKASWKRETRSYMGSFRPPSPLLVGVQRQPGQSVPFSSSGFQ